MNTHTTLVDSITAAIEKHVTRLRKWKGNLVPRIRGDRAVMATLRDRRTLERLAAVSAHVAFRIQYPKSRATDKGVSLSRDRRFKRKVVLRVNDARQLGHREIRLSHADLADIAGAVAHEMQAHGCLVRGALTKAFWQNAFCRARAELRMDKAERRNPTLAETFERARQPESYVAGPDSSPVPTEYEIRGSATRRDLAETAWRYRHALQAVGRYAPNRHLLRAAVSCACGFGHGLTLHRRDGKPARSLQPAIARLMVAVAQGQRRLAETAKPGQTAEDRARFLATWDS